jgi:hypothetical protein
MTRALLALLVGVLLGVGATLWLSPSSISQPPPLDAWLPAEPTAALAPSAVAPAATREATRDFYRQLADADEAELAALIRETAARAPSTDRALALAVLFKRYAELDALRAVRLARDVDAGGTALGVVYGAWARAAPEQVLAALSTVESPDDATDVALAVIQALGADAAAVRRVAAVLATRDGETYPVSPAAPTFGTPVALAATRSALAMTAQRWADLDARRALAVARELDDQRLRVPFETAALRALARSAPADAFAYLEQLDAAALQRVAVSGALVELARANPERVLNVARDLPADTRRMAEMAALQLLAERDPLAAMRHLDSGPLGPERQMLLQIIGRAYGRRDASAALAWARANRAEPMLVSAVIAGVAETDPGRAFDLALALTSPMERMQAVQMAIMATARDDAKVEALANRLLAVDDPAIRDNMASMAISMWAQRAPDRAMDWLLARGQDAPPNAFAQLGQQLAMRDPQSAVAYTARVPDAAREQWANGVGMGYAQSNAQGAVDWLAQFRGEEWYGRTAGTVAMAIAQRDGAAAARLFDELETDASVGPAARLVGAIASNWAGQDPAAAANWAIERASAQERDMIVRNVIGVWSNQDVDGARQWALRLPQGATRDAALTSVLTTSVMQRGQDTVDAGLLNAFASPQSRQGAVMQIVQGLAYGDPAKARAIADAHLDPAARAQAERMIEAARNQSGRAVSFGGPPVMLPPGVAPAQMVVPGVRVAR